MTPFHLTMLPLPTFLLLPKSNIFNFLQFNQQLFAWSPTNLLFIRKWYPFGGFFSIIPSCSFLRPALSCMIFTSFLLVVHCAFLCHCRFLVVMVCGAVWSSILFFFYSCVCVFESLAPSVCDDSCISTFRSYCSAVKFRRSKHTISHVRESK